MPHPKIKGNIIGRGVRKYRKLSGMTQVQLSAALSVDYRIELAPDLLSRIESGERSVRDKEVKALAEVLGVTPNDLFGIC